jgi:hypothetical protein
MDLGIDDCIVKNKPYKLRSLPDDLWTRFITVCKAKGYGEPERILKGGDSE